MVISVRESRLFPTSGPYKATVAPIIFSSKATQSIIQPNCICKPNPTFSAGLKFMVNYGGSSRDLVRNNSGTLVGGNYKNEGGRISYTRTLGSNSGIHYPVPTIVGSSSWSLVLSFKVQSNAAGTYGIAQIADSTINSPGPQLLVQRNTNILKIYDTNTGYSITEDSLSQGSIQHMVLTYDGTIKRLFRNGKETSNFPTPYIGSNPATRLWLGNGYSSSDNADIYMAAFWSRALTYTEALRISSNPWILLSSYNTSIWSNL